MRELGWQIVKMCPKGDSVLNGGMEFGREGAEDRWEGGMKGGVRERERC